MAIPIAIAVAALTKSTKALTTVMDKFSSVFMQSIAFGEDSQKAALALGTTYEDVTKRFEGTIDGLRGSIQTQFIGAFAAMEAGLQGNTAGIAKLINQQILTGTQHKLTARVFAELVAVGGVSLEATNKLAANLITLGNKYGVSTDVLVTAINNLKNSFPTAQLAGMGETMAGAVAQLQSELGPAMSGSLNQVMKLVMDDSMEGYQKLTVLGIGRVREQLMAAQDTASAVEILKRAMMTAGDRFASVVGDVRTGFFKLGVATDVFGKEGKHMRIIQQQFADNARESNEQSVSFAMTLSTLKAEVLSPIIKVLTDKFYPKIVEAASVISEAGKTVSEALSGWIGTLDLTEEGVKDFTLNIVRIMMNTLDSWEITIRSFGDLLTDTVFPALVDLAGKIDSIPDPFKWRREVASPEAGALMASLDEFSLMWAGGPVTEDFGSVLKATLMMPLATEIQSLEAILGAELQKSGMTQEDQNNLLLSIKDQLQGVAESDSEETKEIFRQAYFDPGKFIREFTKAQGSGESFEFSGIGTTYLQPLLTAFEANWELSKNIRDNTAETAKNTKKDTEDTAPMLTDTVFELGATMERILGVAGTSMSDHLLELVDLADRAEQQRALLQETTRRGVGGGGRGVGMDTLTSAPHPQ